MTNEGRRVQTAPVACHVLRRTRRAGVTDTSPSGKGKPWSISLGNRAGCWPNISVRYCRYWVGESTESRDCAALANGKQIGLLPMDGAPVSPLCWRALHTVWRHQGNHPHSFQACIPPTTKSSGIRKYKATFHASPPAGASQHLTSAHPAPLGSLPPARGWPARPKPNIDSAGELPHMPYESHFGRTLGVRYTGAQSVSSL